MNTSNSDWSVNCNCYIRGSTVCVLVSGSGFLSWRGPYGILQLAMNERAAQLYTHCFLNLHPPVSCLPSPQLTLPEGTQPRYGHTLTSCRIGESKVHATTFGGCPVRYDLITPDDKLSKLANTMVLEFGEQSTHYLYNVLVVCPLMISNWSKLTCTWVQLIFYNSVSSLPSPGMCDIATDMQPPLLQCVLTVHQGLTDSVVASLH